MKIIVFEGIDASGKETQSKLLYQSLLDQGYYVHYDSFPRYDTPIGGLIKQHLFNEVEMSEESFHMLLEADRVDFNKRLDRLEEIGIDFVILDRYTLSNLVFGNCKDIDLMWLISLQGIIRPADITFFIDVSVETSMLRRPAGRDKHERDVKLLYDARQKYTAFTEIDPNCYLINGERTVNEIARDVNALVYKKYRGR